MQYVFLYSILWFYQQNSLNKLSEQNIVLKFANTINQDKIKPRLALKYSYYR